MFSVFEYEPPDCLADCEAVPVPPICQLAALPVADLGLDGVALPVVVFDCALYLTDARCAWFECQLFAHESAKNFFCACLNSATIGNYLPIVRR